MPSPRTRPWIRPRAVENAPLNARRQQLVPIYPDEIGPAVQQTEPGPYRHFLPSKMAMQWHVKAADGSGYRSWDTSPRAFVALQERFGPAEARDARSPFNPMAELAQAMQDEMWTQIHTVEEPMRPTLARTVPYPGRLPLQSFEALDDWNAYATTAEMRRRRDRRMDALRELAASDEMIAEIMGRFR